MFRRVVQSVARSVEPLQVEASVAVRQRLPVGVFRPHMGGRQNGRGSVGLFPVGAGDLAGSLSDDRNEPEL
jgi:hypothetical protein